MTWWRKFHQHQQVLVRHLFLMERLMGGPVLEVDGSTIGGLKFVAWHKVFGEKAVHLWRLSQPNGLKKLRSF